MTDHNYRFGEPRYFVSVYVEREADDLAECPVEVKTDEPEKARE